MWVQSILPILTAAIAALVVQLRHHSKTTITIQFKGGAKYPASQVTTSSSSSTTKTDANDASIVTNAEKEAYHRDGFILKKGLLQGEELAALVSAGEELYSQAQDNSLHGSSFRQLSFDLWAKDDRFAQLAFESQMPSLSAELLNMTFSPTNHKKKNGKQVDHRQDEQPSVRILKDGFFGFQSENNTGCGFHVDDFFFWPATDDSPGVNFWIALSPIRISEGGGIRVVNQTLVEPIFEECRQVIREVNPEAPQMPQTCRMENLSPVCHQKMLEASTVFDMEPGDALLWDRWTFHRSEPFVHSTSTSSSQQGQSAAKDEKAVQHKLRYTIRYIPGTAKASGFLREPQESGKVFNTPYYPQVWPSAIKSEINAIQKGLAS